MQVCVFCVPGGSHAPSGGGLSCALSIRRTRHSYSDYHAQPFARPQKMQSTRRLSTCMGQVCFFVSGKERLDVSGLPGKRRLGKICLKEAAGQGYSEESPPSRETQAHPPPARLLSRLLMGVLLARCSGQYFLYATHLTHHIFYLKVYTDACNVR